MRGFTARNTPCMGLVDRRPVVCRNLAMGFWVPLQDDTQVHPGAEWVLQPVRDGEWWNVVDREKCSAVGEGYPQETRLQAPNRLC